MSLCSFCLQRAQRQLLLWLLWGGCGICIILVSGALFIIGVFLCVQSLIHKMNLCCYWLILQLTRKPHIIKERKIFYLRTEILFLIKLCAHGS